MIRVGANALVWGIKGWEWAGGGHLLFSGQHF